MDVMITGTKPGKIIEEIPCYVEYADEPIYLHIEADIKVKNIQTPFFNFNFLIFFLFKGSRVDYC